MKGFTDSFSLSCFCWAQKKALHENTHNEDERNDDNDDHNAVAAADSDNNDDDTDKKWD